MTSLLTLDLTCVKSDGSAVLDGPSLLVGGSRSGSAGCGEDELWAGVKQGKEKKDRSIERGSLVFAYKNIIYMIDGGLCPCFRCCSGLLALATRTASTIIVRPITDYEIISASRTRLDLANVYVLIFRPDSAKFLVYHSSPAEGPAGTQQVVAVVDPAKAKAKCNTCNSIYMLSFSGQAVQADYIMPNGVTTKVPCPKPKCKTARVMLVLNTGSKIEPKDVIKLTAKG